MADCSVGPVSTLPGSIRAVPVGTECDEHPGVLAVKRVQGETDSFGCEYLDMCQECYDKYKEEMRNVDNSGICDWCKKSADRVFNHRDIEEGSCGRVYQVCQACIDAEKKEWAEERDCLDDDWDDGDWHDGRFDDEDGFEEDPDDKYAERLGE